MKKSTMFLPAVAFLLGTYGGSAVAQNFDWADEPGGVFNIPSVEFNPDYYGWGSYGFGERSGIRYNKVDMHVGSDNPVENTMYIENENQAQLYDNNGYKIALAWQSPIGYNHVLGERDGGLAAGGITQIKEEDDGRTYTMVYVWSVNSQLGRQSGWMKISDLTPDTEIARILNQNKAKRDEILSANGANGSGGYEENVVVEAYLPDDKYDYYVTAGRTGSAGRARYYYTDTTPDYPYISGLMNIPETGSQRYGVAHDVIRLGTKFYVAKYVDQYELSLYPENSDNEDGSMTLVFGYAVTSAGEKIYSWINQAALESTGNESTGSTDIVHITKRNSTGYALDGDYLSNNYQNIFLWSANQNSVNQQWVEIDRGDGYYSYQKMGTNHCIDGGGPGAVNRGNVYLYSCSSSNTNQQFKKVSTSGGAYQLRKRSNENYALDGGNTGVNGQNVGIWNSGTSSHNLQWIVTKIGTL